jgi:hypothetical protein
MDPHLLAFKQQQITLRNLLKDFREQVRVAEGAYVTHNRVPVVYDRAKLMRPHLRYMNWNIEWMDLFYKDDTEFLISNTSVGITNVKTLCEQIAKVIFDINPDILAIEEGPSSLPRMDLFQREYLADQFDVFGYEVFTHLCQHTVLKFIDKRNRWRKTACVYIGKKKLTHCEQSPNLSKSNGISSVQLVPIFVLLNV